MLETKQVANFTTHRWPQVGSIWLGAFVMGLAVIALWHLVAGRRAAQKLGPPKPAS